MVMIKCPICGQEALKREGVPMAPILVKIYDKLASRQRVASDTLAWWLYPGESRAIAKRRIRINIWRLRSMLAGTEAKVVWSEGFYTIERPKRAA